MRVSELIGIVVALALVWAAVAVAVIWTIRVVSS
jgi:hypothetical protein